MAAGGYSQWCLLCDLNWAYFSGPLPVSAVPEGGPVHCKHNLARLTHDAKQRLQTNDSERDLKGGAVCLCSLEVSATKVLSPRDTAIGLTHK